MDGNALREGDTVQFVQVFDEKRGKMRAEDITGGITTDGYNAPRVHLHDKSAVTYGSRRDSNPQSSP